ncbi:MAG: C4-dicarboxylate ABC transporter [Candidatus Entotheonella factor]|uniref:C4-dicarboxylate ABC transporter n=1 Tax=Entotheonella factor TaxID=1429438 RepID=W4LH42_ENTF1|nr:MAG: C4-dicarboxylate ABC transporter [Candidatus Entotheonella factor]
MIVIGGLLLLAALVGTPLFVILGGAAWLLFWLAEIDTAAVVIELYRLAQTPTLLSIPLFTFSGYVLAAGQAPQRLVRCAQALVGWLPGGLALVTLLACAFFTAFTGASGVTIVALGGLLLPLLLQERYPEPFSLGLLTTCGSLGLLFPPSLPVILYGLVAQVPIELIFLAGLLPGGLLIVLLSLFSVHRARRAEVPVHTYSWREMVRAVWAAKWELSIPVWVLGGIYGGLVTVSEAALLTAVYTLLVASFVHREVHLWRDLPDLITQSMTLIGAIFIVLGTALGLTSYLIDAQVPQQLLRIMEQYIQHRVVFLLVLNAFLLLVGCLMDVFSAIIVVVPLIAPLAAQYDVHPLHLSIIFLTNLEIGYSTPPVGLNLFLSSLRFERPITQLYRASWPFLLVLVVALLLITYIPDLSLALLKWFGYAELLTLQR